MIDSPFFIIGTQRGGTTLLRLMLNMHSKLAIPPESHFFIPLLKAFDINDELDKGSLYKALSIIENHPRWSTWSVSQSDIDNLKDNTSFPFTIATLIDSLFQLQILSMGKVRWGDKTPEYIDIIPQLIRLYPLASFIVLVRDGRDVELSLKDRGWHGWSVWQRAKYWRESINKMDILRRSNKSIFIKYEDIVLNTEGELSKICEFLGIEYETQMLNFHLNYESNISDKEKEIGVHRKLARKPQKSDIDRWKNQTNRFEVWAFEAVAYRQLIKGGYTLAYFNTNNFFHRAGKCFYVILGCIILGFDRLFHKLIPSGVKKKISKTRFYMRIKNTVKSI